jgi:hypothetical protein
MASSRLTTWGIVGGLVAAIAFALSSLVAFVFDVNPFGPVGSLSWVLIESFDAIGEGGIWAVLVALHARQAPRYGRLGTAGVIAACVGIGALLVATVLWLFTAYPVGEGPILNILESVAMVALLIGFPLLGIATVRARVLPRWSGLLLIAYPAILMLAFSLVDFYGEIRVLAGLPWLALAFALWSQRGARATQSANSSVS